jgi:imidazoleglycerol phosphate synthase glutamine amidotransferase subunit HisH
VLWQEHLFGFQCHPEKSHQYGLAVYQQFIHL